MECFNVFFFFWPCSWGAYPKMSDRTLEWALPVTPLLPGLGWRPFVPGFIAPIIKHKFVNLLLRGQDPFPQLWLPQTLPLSPLLLQLLFLVDELLLLTNTREREKEEKKKQVPKGILCPLVLSMWICVPVDLAPLESPSKSQKWGLQLNVLIGFLSEKPY